MGEDALVVVLDEERKIVHVSLKGDLVPETIREIAVGVLAEHAGWHRIWDLSEASLASLTSDELQALAEFAKSHESHPGQIRSAIVAPRDLEFGVGRMYEMLGESTLPVALRVFRTQVEAIAWIESMDTAP